MRPSSYINPFRHGLATHVRDWPYWSFHRAVRAVLFAEDWQDKIIGRGNTLSGYM
jgi:putative transposase